MSETQDKPSRTNTDVRTPDQECLAPLWFVRLSKLPSDLFGVGVGFLILTVMVFEYWLILPQVIGTVLPTPLPLSVIHHIVTIVVVNPFFETVVFVWIPCEFLLQFTWGRRLVSHYWWVRWFPFTWGSVVFGAAHYETKPLVFLLLTAVLGALYLLMYLHVRIVSPWVALCVTTSVHALKNLAFAILLVGPHLG